MSVCIFCGKDTRGKKTKEHVFPQWLIEFTNNSNESGTFGFNLASNPPKPRIIPFKAFTFPACHHCNQEFKVLENGASAVIKKMAKLSGLTEIDLNTLLDWMDKIRIGLLLGFNFLDRNELEVKPSFYIQKGIGLFDRMVIIKLVDDKLNFLSSRGCDTLLFRVNPNCFLLVINNIYLLNICTTQLFARRLGFPYFAKAFYEEEINRFSAIIVKGNERIMYPLIRKPFLLKGVEIYQPMFPSSSIGENIKYYESDYVKERSLDWKKGVGRIFVNKNQNIHFYKNNFEWIPQISSNRWELTLAASKQVFSTQIDLVNNLPLMDRLSVKKKMELEYINKFGIRSNKRLLKIIDRGLI